MVQTPAKQGQTEYVRHGNSMAVDYSAAHRICLGADSEHRLCYRRDDWIVEVTCTSELTATKSMFQPRGHFVVRENGEVLFQYRWSSDIPRTCS